MKQTIFLAGLLFAVQTGLNAQIILKGIIKDNTGKPISSINVDLLKASDSVKLSSTLSSNAGEYTLFTPGSGAYIVSISSLFYEPQYLSIKVAADTVYKLNAITLYARDKAMQGITVISKKPLYELKIDRVVVNVQQNLSMSGSTALEILERSPGVSVNREKNSISLNGKGNVLVMINDRITSMPMDALLQLLNGMQSVNISKIELITSPGAKYDASSAGGIINIVMEKGNSKGLNGNFSLIAGYGGKEKAGSSVTLNYRNNKFNVYGDLSYYRNHYNQNYYLNKTLYSKKRSVTDSSEAIRELLSDYYSIRGGIDYFAGKRVTLGGFISENINVASIDADIHGKSIDTLQSMSFQHILNRGDKFWSGMQNNFYVNQKFNDSVSLNYDLTYMHYYSSNKQFYQSNYYDNMYSLKMNQNLRQQKKDLTDFWVGKIDYTNQLKKDTKLEIGAKGSQATYHSNIHVEQSVNGNAYRTDSLLTQPFSLKEQILGTYVNYETTIGSKMQLVTGLRYEYFHLVSNADNGKIVRNYGNLFPNVYFSYAFNKNTVLQLAYNRKAARPVYSDFAPYNIYVDKSTSFTGNTSLDQSISDGIKADLKFRNKYFLSLAYTYENKSISRLQAQVDTVNYLVYYSTINFKYAKIYSASLYFPIKVNSWWNIQTNLLDVYRILQAPSSLNNFLISQNTVEVSATQSFSLPKDIHIDLSCYYHSPQLTGLIRNKNYFNINIGAQKIFNANNKLKFSLTNILGGYFDYDILNDRQLNINMNSKYLFTPPTFRVIYTRNFGNSQSGFKRKNAPGSEEVQNRIGKD